MSAHDAACGHPQHYSDDGTLMSRYTCGRLMREKLTNLHDSRIRRCWYCGAQNYGTGACSACTAPANRLDLGEAAT